VPALDVPELVRQRLHRLCVADVAANPHDGLRGVGATIRPAALAPRQAVAVRADLGNQPLPQPGRGLPVQQDRADTGQRVPLGFGKCRTRTPPGNRGPASIGARVAEVGAGQVIIESVLAPPVLAAYSNQSGALAPLPTVAAVA